MGAVIDFYVKNLPKEELDRILALPKRKMSVDKDEFIAYFDGAERVCYLCDDNGKLIGKKLVFSEAARTPMAAAVAATSQAGADAAVSNSQDNAAEEEEEEERVFSSKQVFLSCVISFAACCLLVAILLVVGVLKFGGSSDDKFAYDQKFEVVQALCDIIPGQEITSAMLGRVTIDGETFNQASLLGETFYGWSSYASVVGMSATEFIPAGQCMTYSNVSATYNPPENPFSTLPEGYAYLDIPVNLSYSYVDDILIGRYLDLRVEVTTQINQAERVDTEDVPGLEHSSSITAQTITDIYSLSGVFAVDLIAQDGSSLFQTFSSYNMIPDGELAGFIRSHTSTIMKLNPTLIPEESMVQYNVATIRIYLPQDQVKAIGNLTSENTAVKITKVYDTYVTDTESRSEFVNQSKFTAGVLGEILGSLS